MIWRDKFQEKLDKIAGNYELKLACETWNPGAHPSRNETKITSTKTEEIFPFLELEILWNNSGKLESQVHQKKNQLLKYLNK